MFITILEFRTRFPKIITTIIDDIDLQLIINETEETINYFTFERIRNLKLGILSLSEFRIKMVKNAMYQAVYFDLINKKIIDNIDNEGNIKSYKLGDLSISMIIIDEFVLNKNSKNEIIRSLGIYSYRFLTRTGLMNISNENYYEVSSINKVGED